MPRLQVLNGKRQGATFPVNASAQGVVIGHRNTAVISIDDPWVSWDHARIFFQDGSFWIEDLGSTNGTFVNCVRVKRERLKHEDIVFFGKTHVIFLAVDQASQSNDAALPDDKKRSDYEINVQQLAAAAEQWTGPPAGRPRGNETTGALKVPTRSPVGSGSVGPAIPVPADELSDPLNLAGFARGEPDESSAAARDPFRAGGDPWAQSSSAQQARVPGDVEDADPFASARANRDPFDAGPASRDPRAFDAGPASRDPRGFSSGDPFEQKGERSFAETHHDDFPPEPLAALSPLSPLPSDSTKVRNAGNQLDGFEIDDPTETGVNLATPSAAEVSSLLDKRSGEEDALDDLDTLLGDAAARTPDPNAPAPGFKRPSKPSEALTRPFDAANAARMIEEDSTPKAQKAPGPRSAVSAAPSQTGPRPPSTSRMGQVAPPPAPVPAPPPPPRTPTLNLGSPQNLGTPLSNARTQQMPAATTGFPLNSGVGAVPGVPVAAPGDEGRPVAPGELAFEVAKLQDEVRRLRMALDAARQQSPEKVRVAVDGLRAEELGRQAKEIADLRKQLAELKSEFDKRQAELDDVTADMIEKEDLIDQLKARLAEMQDGASTVRGVPPVREQPLGESADELKALEF